MTVSDSAEIRLAEGATVHIHPTVKIDDDVRIVVSATGRLFIDENTKIGKGTIINCGGVINIGKSVAVYGYCYFQSSIWRVEDGVRIYNHGDIYIGDNVIVSPFSVISHSANVPDGVIIRPHAVVGNWFDDCQGIGY